MCSVAVFPAHCGRGGIRTHDAISGITVFKTVSFNHSDTLPQCAGLLFVINHFVLEQTGNKTAALNPCPPLAGLGHTTCLPYSIPKKKKLNVLCMHREALSISKGKAVDLGESHIVLRLRSGLPKI